MESQTAPQRFTWVQTYRAWIRRLWIFRLPNVSPDAISLVGFCLSLFVIPVFSISRAWTIALLIFILFLDWLDGAVARQYQRGSQHGWLVDIGLDRFSEAVIFLPLGVFWAALWCVNTLLSLVGIFFHKSIALPGRFIFLLALLLHVEANPLTLILSSFWLLLPMGVANMFPIFAVKLFPRSNWPVDFGAYFHGQPLFGSHKTYRGILAGVLGAVLTFWLQRFLYLKYTWVQDISLFSYTSQSLSFGALLGFGALAGDLLKSFFKRRVNIAPGQSWFPFDQIDYIVGGIAFGAFVYLPSLSHMFTMLALGFALHLLVTWIGEGTGIRERAT
ncbi:MAG: CDP-archaeol synthase [Candidatus Nomurabacteria bacterium]|nr:MAG: CDP-archaeol synthase [Candidatus Nomurabacteria bacterium]